MPKQDLPQSKFVELRDKFEQAEKLTKEVEEFNDEVVIPAINELRYAGYHLSIALVDDLDDPVGEIVKATNHCRRATYDAASAGISAAILFVETFVDEFSGVVISEVITDWPAKLARVHEIQDNIPEGRVKDVDKDRDYEKQAQSFRDIKGIYRELVAARDDLNLKLTESRKESRRFVVNLAFAAAIGIASIIVAILLA